MAPAKRPPALRPQSDAAKLECPYDVAARYQRAKILLVQGEAAAAVAHLTEVLHRHPEHTRALLCRAIAWDLLDRAQEAATDSSQAVHLDGSQAVAHLVHGTILAHQGDGAKAIAALTRALEINKNLAPAYRERGLAYALRRNFYLARGDWDRFLALEPGSADGYLQRSSVHHALGKGAEAAADYAQALKLDPLCLARGTDPHFAAAARRQVVQRLLRIIDDPELTSPSNVSPSSGQATAVRPPLQQRSPSAPIAPTTRRARPTSAKLAAPSTPTLAPDRFCGGTKEFSRDQTIVEVSSPSAAEAAEVILQRKRPRPTSQPKKASERAELLKDYMEQWKKPALITLGSIVVLAAFYLSWSIFFGKPNRVAVFPARGMARYEGRPMPRAAIFLHPVGEHESEFPLPHATVNADGSFVVGTYSHDDGAPAGEYRVTAQWFTQATDPEKDDGRLPQNQLPRRYARAETSGLSVRIEEGDNALPALQLRR